MADTVKKSRIVSEPECLSSSYADSLTEDTSLQDIINEEFNQRLKNCMKHDDTHIEPNADHIALTYEAGEVVLKNGADHSLPTALVRVDLLTDTSNANLTSTIGSLNGAGDVHRQNGATEAFHQEETIVASENREGYSSVIQESFTSDHFVEESRHEHVSHVDQSETSTTTHSDLVVDGCEMQVSMETKEVVTTVEKVTVTKQQTESFSSSSLVETVESSAVQLGDVAAAASEVSPQSEQSDSFVNKEMPSPEDEMDAPFDNITVTDVDNESLTAKERFLSTVTDLDDDVGGKLATVKDRMFLSTDSACLLFTQTVVQSPMLTPTDENYDFLQGLHQNSADLTAVSDAAAPVKDEPTPLAVTEVVPEEPVVEPVCLNEDRMQQPLQPELTAGNRESRKDSDDDKLDFSEISAADEVCHQLESANSDLDVSEHCEEPQIIEQIPVDIKAITSEFLQCEISAVDGDLQVHQPFSPTQDVSAKQAPEIVEELIKEAEDLVENRENVEEVIEHYEQSPELCQDDIISGDTRAETPLELAETLSDPVVDTDLEECDVPIKSSPSKVSEISKIFTADEKPARDVAKTPSPLPETFEDIRKTKELFERKSKSPVCVVQNSEFRSTELITDDDDDDESDVADFDTNLVCPLNVSSTVSSESSFVETRTETQGGQEKVLKKKKSKKSKKDNEKENISVKSSFSKFDALSKKTVLHVRSADSGKAQEKFNGAAQIDTSLCKSCAKQVFQMEQIKAEKSIWHKNCFRCQECNKQLNVDTYQSNEGVLYCKPHFKALFTPKAVEEDQPPARPRKHEMIIRENQPEELPPDVVRASDKPDLGLDELQNLNVKERFQVFEHHDALDNSLERTPSAVNVKRSPSILSKLAKFQSKGMDIGVADDSLNGVPVEESSSEEEEDEDDGIEGEDADLIRAKRAQREKPLHFNNMSDIMSKWESAGHQMTREERREERKQEIQSIRSRLFMGKQGKMKEMYQQAVAESESGANVKKHSAADTDICEGSRDIKDKFERGEALTSDEQQKLRELEEDKSVFETGISKKSRSIFLELDANASKAPQLTPVSPVKPGGEVRRAREAFMNRQASEDVVRSTDQVDDVTVKTADISNRFKFFETYSEPEKQRKQFRITPPRDGQDKTSSPEREVYRDPEVVRSEEQQDDADVVQKSHTATKMLSIFRQMEENLSKDPLPAGPKPLKRFTPPPEPVRDEGSSGEEVSESEDDDEDEASDAEDRAKLMDDDLLEAQKAARAKQLRAKFEKWEATELQREQNNSSVNIAEELAEGDSQIESARSLRARFESMKEVKTDTDRAPRVKVNRFVDTTNNVETCKSCEGRVYPLEKVACHNNVYHKNCFRCRECNTILRMDSYTYNQGLLYCVPHFKRLFIAKGNYESGFGLDQHKEKWNAVASS